MKMCRTPGSGAPLTRTPSTTTSTHLWASLKPTYTVSSPLTLVSVASSQTIKTAS